MTISTAPYFFVLAAYAHVEVVVYVAGLRQLSIVLLVLGGTLVLGEPAARFRIAASLVILAGVALITFATT